MIEAVFYFEVSLGLPRTRQRSPLNSALLSSSAVMPAHIASCSASLLSPHASSPFRLQEGESKAHAKEVRDAFVEEFGLTKEQVPLLRLSVGGNQLGGASPFSLG